MSCRHSSDRATCDSNGDRPLAVGRADVGRADVLVSAANSLTPIKRNLVRVLTHLQSAKVQLLFGHCGCKNDLYAGFDWTWGVLTECGSLLMLVKCPFPFIAFHYYYFFIWTVGNPVG